MKKFLFLSVFSVCLFISLAPMFVVQKHLHIFQKLYSKNSSLSEIAEEYHCMLDVTTLRTKVDVNYEKLKRRYKRMNQRLNNTLSKRNNHAQFVPLDCISSETVAIIIPIRDRTEHLHVLLGHLHPILQKQQIRYQIYTVNQLGNETFNKGMLMNAGFNFARKDGKLAGHDYNCFIFHDVDLLAESELFLYRCGRYNRHTNKTGIFHMAHTIQKYDYRPMCCGITVGGVLAFTEQQYIEVNGYSNAYWGWGGEDDDMNVRIKSKNLSIERVFNGQSTRYTMISHSKDVLNPKNANRNRLLHTVAKRLSTDGLRNGAALTATRPTSCILSQTTSSKPNLCSLSSVVLLITFSNL